MSVEKHKSPASNKQAEKFLDETWTAQQDKEYKEYLARKREELALEQKAPRKQSITRYRKTDAELAAYGDMIAALMNSIQFAEIALDQDRLFDETGFLHSSEVFLDHARNVATHLKKIRKLKEAAKG